MERGKVARLLHAGFLDRSNKNDWSLLYLRYPACKCPEPYTGTFCELLKSDQQLIDLKGQNKKESAGSIFGFFVFCVLVVLAVLFLYAKTRGQSSRDKTAMIRAAHIKEEASKSLIMEEVDFDGVMEDVELL